MSRFSIVVLTLGPSDPGNGAGWSVTDDRANSMSLEAFLFKGKEGNI